jgi:hypothetical protein
VVAKLADRRGTLAAGRARAARGTTKVVLRLTARARRQLRRSHRLRGRLSLTTVAADGTRAAQARRVTVRSSAARRRG